MVPISVKKVRNERLTFSKPSHASAPSFNNASLRSWLSGQVTASTKMTAKPNCIAVSTFLLIARNEHMPKKKASAMFSTNMAFVARLK